MKHEVFKVVKASMVVHTCDLSNQEEKAGSYTLEFKVWGLPRLSRKTVNKKQVHMQKDR